MEEGTLVYVRGGTSGLSTIEQIDAEGNSRTLVAEPARRFFPRLSPDGQQLIYTQADGVDYTLWRHDMRTGVSVKFSSEAGRATAPAWSPDGKYVFYLQGASRGLAVRRADGSGEAQTVMENVPGNFWSVSPDGKTIAFQISVGDRQLDIWTAPIEMSAAGVKAGKLEYFYGSPQSETQSAFSPDGDWLAYSSSETGQADVYVRNVRNKDVSTHVSAGPGSQTRWSKDGRHLFYETRDRRIMSVRYRVEHGAFLADPPTLWSSRQLGNTNVFPNYDLTPDGNSIVAMVPVGDEKSQARDHITVVRNLLGALSD